jgi:hypothetical protein
VGRRLPPESTVVVGRGMSVVRLLLERLDERMLFEGVRVRATSLAFGGDGRTSKCAEATEGSAFGVGGKLDDDGELRSSE